MDAFSEDRERFLFSIMTWKKGEDYFHYQNPVRCKEDPEPSLFEKAVLIPRSFYSAVPSEGLTSVGSDTLASNASFLKRCSPLLYDPRFADEQSAGSNMLHEAEVCEKLLHTPHPNICRYLGYVRSEIRLLVGLCFEKHIKDLDAAVEDKDDLDVDAIVEGIRAGLKHLHSSGFVHVRRAFDCADSHWSLMCCKTE